MNFLDKTDLAISMRDRLAFRWRMGLGACLNYFSGPAAESARLAREAYVMRARSPGTTLPTEEVRRMSQFMHDVQEKDRRREYFQTTQLERTFQGQMVPLVSRVLRSDPTIKKVVNIGAHYAYCDWELARQFEGVDFLSVDFASNLAEFNAEFVRPNLTFRSGYAMQMLLDGELDADLYFMSSTCVVIQNHELRAYFDAFRRRGRYVVLNEPIYIGPGDAVIDPESLAVDRSQPVYQYVNFEGDAGPLCFVHPYRAMVQAAGFDVRYYRAFLPDFTNLRLVHLIGC